MVFDPASGAECLGIDSQAPTEAFFRPAFLGRMDVVKDGTSASGRAAIAAVVYHHMEAGRIVITVEWRRFQAFIIATAVGLAVNFISLAFVVFQSAMACDVEASLHILATSVRISPLVLLFNFGVPVRTSLLAVNCGPTEWTAFYRRWYYPNTKIRWYFSGMWADLWCLHRSKHGHIRGCSLYRNPATKRARGDVETVLVYLSDAEWVSDL